jgi:hypothetical protein
MNKLILATGSNLGYLNRMGNYLNSIERNSNFDSNYLVFLGDETISLTNKNIDVVNVYHKDLEIIPSNSCLQHGEFLKSEQLDKTTNDNDVIFFTDGDIEIQRPMTDSELNQYRNFKDDEIYVGYNASPTDTLFDEANRLGFTGYETPILRNNLQNIKVYNTGVLGMNKKTWIKLKNQFVAIYPEVDKLFNHYAKQQWLLSFLFAVKNYEIYEMPYDIHNHRHYPSPIGTRQDQNGTVYFNNKIVLFKHKW